MRIISGSARGRRLFSPKNSLIRPTADRIKESLFNILNFLIADYDDCRALDIFAGTGNLGLEALSRGAANAVFIDSHKESVALVIKNLRMLGFADRGRVIEREAISALRSLEKREPPFRLVFIDPPYRQGLAERVLEYLAGSNLIDENSLVIAEISSGELLPTAFENMIQFDRRVYGDTAIVFFRRMPEGNANHKSLIPNQEESE